MTMPAQTRDATRSLLPRAEARIVPIAPVPREDRLIGFEPGARALLERALRGCEPSGRLPWLFAVGGPGGTGLTALRRARDAGIDGPLLGICVDEMPDALAAFSAGADGVLCLRDGLEQIARGLRDAVRGMPALTATTAAALIARAREAATPPAPAISGESCGFALTARERQIIALADKGYTYPQTARLIGVRVSTVYTHVRRLYEKMAVNNLPQALYEARRAGLL